MAEEGRFTVAKLLGSMPVTIAANLKAFREDPNVSVILMSLKSEVKAPTAGGKLRFCARAVEPRC